MRGRRSASVVGIAVCALVLAACGAGSSAGVPTVTGGQNPAITTSAHVTMTSGASPIRTASAPLVPTATGGASIATTGAPTIVTSPAAGGHTCAAPYPSGAQTTVTVFCADPSAMEAATVIRVVDGDTIHVLLHGVDETVRFYGIDTTERGEACFAEGSERTRELVGREVRLRPDARERDKYGRLLRYVYTPAGLSIDAEMVDEGLAHAWRADGALRAPIIVLEDAARAKHVGCLWG